MNESVPVDNYEYSKKMEKYLSDKRTELIKGLLKEDYTKAQIARIFKMDTGNLNRLVDSLDKKNK
jgi:hypothetical protein